MDKDEQTREAYYNHIREIEDQTRERTLKMFDTEFIEEYLKIEKRYDTLKARHEKLGNITSKFNILGKLSKRYLKAVESMKTTCGKLNDKTFELNTLNDQAKHFFKFQGHRNLDIGTRNIEQRTPYQQHLDLRFG